MAVVVERGDLYSEVSKQLPRRVDESTRTTATRFALGGGVGASDFFEAHDDLRIIQLSEGTRNGEARFLNRMRFFGRSRWK